MKRDYILPILLLMVSLGISAQSPQERLSLPRLDQLSSERVLMVMQDSEGFLWYATEGGGVCRDDGRRMLVLRSDAEHPDMLSSNDVASLAEAAGKYIIIGTFHGAFVLDKRDYSIRRLEDVDDKRVDDIVVSRKDGHWWLTANKKIFEYSADGKLLNRYAGGDKYIFRLYEDEQGRLCGVEWEGGILRLENGSLEQIDTKWPKDFNFNRITTDQQGRQLVADVFGHCYALSSTRQTTWFNGRRLTRMVADSVRMARGLSARPTALAYDKDSILWFSTGKDIRCMKSKEEVVLADTKDVSAMTFTKDGTLWLATIFGTVMTCQNGQLTTDDYASNEYGDAVVALDTDSIGCILIVSDRYVRLYDPVRKTLRQQNIEDDGVYRVELQETEPGLRWSQPEKVVVERMPQWVWWLLGALLLGFISLLAYVGFLHRQRKRFVDTMKRLPVQEQAAISHQDEEVVTLAVQTVEQTYIPVEDEWLQKAIATVETHIADEHYGVEQLSADMCMSRMTFYRKIQTATGQKPTEFIRTIRLRRAAELLQAGEKTITEISYATGFSSVSYFSRCFRTMFGVPPTLFGKTTTAEVLSPNEMPS